MKIHLSAKEDVESITSRANAGTTVKGAKMRLLGRPKPVLDYSAFALLPGKNMRWPLLLITPKSTILECLAFSVHKHGQ